MMMNRQDWQDLLNLSCDHSDIKSILRSKQMRDIINENWRSILENLPSIIQNPSRLDQSKLKLFEKDTSPAFSVISYLGTRSIKLNELIDSFTRLNLEKGLLLLGVPESDIKLEKRPASQIRVKSGTKLRVECKAQCFPRASYEYFKSGQKVDFTTSECQEGVFQIENIQHKDSGIYECLIRQQKSSGQINQLIVKFEILVEEDPDTQNLIAIIEPKKISLELGSICNIRCRIMSSQTNLDNLKFQWYKSNRSTNQFEAVTNNSTANSINLIINEVGQDDVGYYKCNVIREDKGIFSQGFCEVSLATPCEYDLKIALIICNGSYEKYEETSEMKNCRECHSISRSLNLIDLSSFETAERLRNKLERLGYLVMSFVDLRSEDYLRVIRLFRKACTNAQRVSALIYVSGHGFNNYHQDILVSIDARNILHENNHNSHCAQRLFGLSSLVNLFENFVSSPEENQKFSLICLWDLCRKQWVENNNNNMEDVNQFYDIDRLLNGTLDYSLLFSCNVGTNGYDLCQDRQDLNLKKGTIFTNLFLNNLELNRNNNIHDIGVKINKDIDSLKQNSEFQVLSKLKYHSTLAPIDLSAKANNDKTFCMNVEKYYLGAKYQKPDNVFDDFDSNSLLCTYRFLPDVFINSMILEVDIKVQMVVLNFIYHYPLRMHEIQSHLSTRKLFRLQNLHFIEVFNNPIQLFVTKPDQTIKTVELTIPEHFRFLIADMRSPDINDYVEIKKNITTNCYDSFSISSDDFFNMIQYDENNDESDNETMSTTETNNSSSTNSTNNNNKNYNKTDQTGE